MHRLAPGDSSLIHAHRRAVNLFSEAGVEKLVIALEGNTTLKKIWPPWVMRYRQAWEKQRAADTPTASRRAPPPEFARLKQRRPQTADPPMISVGSS